MIYKGKECKIKTVQVIDIFSETIEENAPKGNIIDIKIEVVSTTLYPIRILYFYIEEKSLKDRFVVEGVLF